MNPHEKYNYVLQGIGKMKNTGKNRMKEFENIRFVGRVFVDSSRPMSRLIQKFQELVFPLLVHGSVEFQRNG